VTCFYFTSSHSLFLYSVVIELAVSPRKVVSTWNLTDGCRKVGILTKNHPVHLCAVTKVHLFTLSKKHSLA